MAKDERLIDELLRHSFFLMTEAALNDDAATSDVLAGTLFNYAVEMKWIEEPEYPEPDLYAVEKPEYDSWLDNPGRFSIDGEQLSDLGDWEVPLEYRRRFFERIRSVPANSGDDEAPLDFKTNPAEIIESFCTIFHLHHSTSFITLLAPEQSIDAPDPTVQRRVLRLMERPDIRKRTSVRPNKSQRFFAKCMREKMVAYDSKNKFTDLEVEHLLWIRA